MKPRSIQICGRCAGAILGLSALGLIARCFISLAPLPPVVVHGPRSLVIGTSLFFAAFFLRAAYLSWFRWSPLAIRHLVGDVFFFVTVSSCFVVPTIAPPLGLPWFVLALPVCYTLYRVIAHLISHRAFPINSRPPPLPAMPSHG